MVTVTELNRAPDGRFESLEATGSITDPQGNTVTDLSRPVQVTEEASTFTESNITVTTNNTAVTNGSIELSGTVDGLFVDDFEDGVDPNWTGGTSKLSAVTSPALSQTQSGELVVNSSNDPTVESPSVGDSTTDAKFKIEFSAIPDGFAYITFFDSSDTDIGAIRFDSDGTINWYDASITTIQSFTANTTYNIELLWDFPNDQAEVVIDGTTYGPYSFENSGSSWDYIEIVTFYDGGGYNIYVDNDAVSNTSGNALVEWDSGVPADLDSYDLATFQKTLDSETVTIDVEDGSGNVLFSDISQNFDISTVDTSKEITLRANLSRNDTANNPTVDYLARRFNRS